MNDMIQFVLVMGSAVIVPLSILATFAYISLKREERLLEAYRDVKRRERALKYSPTQERHLDKNTFRELMI